MGCKMEEKYFNRHTKFEMPVIEECQACDDSLLFDERTGEPKYNDMEQVWQNLYQFIRIFVYPDSESEVEEELRIVGGEILKWIKKKDAFAVSMLLAFHSDFLDMYFFNDKNNERGIEIPEDARCLLNALIKL